MRAGEGRAGEERGEGSRERGVVDEIMCNARLGHEGGGGGGAAQKIRSAWSGTKWLSLARLVVRPRGGGGVAGRGTEGGEGVAA